MKHFKEELKIAADRKLPPKSTLTFASWLAFISLAALVWCGLDYFVFHKFFPSSELQNSSTHGTFGDFVGGVIGTVLAFVTVLLVWLTYQSQKEELNELRKLNTEQVEIQALSALIPLFKQNINEIDEILNSDMVRIGEFHEDYKNGVLDPARKRRQYYEDLLNRAEKQLLEKSDSLLSKSNPNSAGSKKA